MALAGSPSEKPIAVIYSASDVYEAIPLPLTGLNSNHLRYVKVSERDEGVNRLQGRATRVPARPM